MGDFLLELAEAVIILPYLRKIKKSNLFKNKIMYKGEFT